MSLLKIAFRNVKKDKKNSLFIGLTIFIAALIFFAINFTMNGVEEQVLKGYLNLQSGHVIIEWKDMENVSKMSTTKFLSDLKTFDPKEKDKNDASIKALKEYGTADKEKVSGYFPTIKRGIQFSTQNNHDTVILFGITKEDKDFLEESKTIKIEEGEFISPEPNGICISREKADLNNLSIGDEITTTIVDLADKKTDLTLKITGIYENGAGYDNLYGFLDLDQLRSYYAYGEDYFDYIRVYLKDTNGISAFSKDLNSYLTANNTNLRAESYTSASTFYTTVPKTLRIFFNCFVVLLLLVIGVGVSSTIRMNLYERMKIFGTLRAIGYSKRQCFLIVFYEMALICLAALGLSFLVMAAALAILNIGGNGVYVGSGQITYVLGGERFYPSMKFINIVLGVAFMLGLSIIVTYRTMKKLIARSITDLLLKRQTAKIPH